MSTISQNVLNASTDNGPKEILRKYAVAAALEVIAARATGSSGNVNLSYEFEQLSNYADQIQAALEAE